MLESPRGLRLIVLAAIVLCIVACMTGARAADDRTALRIAVVDIQKLIDENTMVKAFNDSITKEANTFKVKNEVMQRNPLLTEEDQNALAALTAKDRAAGAAGLSKDDKAKMEELQKRGANLNEDYQRVSSLPNGGLGDVDAAKMKNYNKTGNDSVQRLAAEQNRIKNELDTREKTVNEQVLEAMQKSLADVAKKNGYNLVLSKQVAPYAEFDCTKDVLALLNKKDKG